ncbi:response regulator transcription factor [Streptomyces sp. NPDC091371]|uniref:helix-turn-helix transcriptional regulator n=1 Tax=Streptomyces sp. NPDC091371 TaxID=3155303 RepID=UPI00343DAF55
MPTDILTEERTTRTALTLAVHATDSITARGVELYFGAFEDIELLAPGRETGAEVLLVIAGEVTDEVIEWMGRAAQRSRVGEMRIILVANDIDDWKLVRAFDHGLVCFMTRGTATLAQVRDTVLASRAGRAELPGSFIRSLIDRMHTAQQGALAPRGPSPAASAFSPREIDVLRLLADGWDTAEVACRLNYSERTVKSVITSMMNRLGLRNRQHAVAHAIKSGVL